MEAQQMELINQNNNQHLLNLDLQIIPIEDHYFLSLEAIFNEEHKKLFVQQTFLLFIIELRTGMNERSINVLKHCILDFCDEALSKELNGFGFIINGQYFTIKKPNLEAIKQILNSNFKISSQDNYILTLIKLRHVIQKQIYKYDKKFQQIDLIFFTSYVQIDHSLGIKKRSYINLLNEHSAQCHDEVIRIQKALKKQMNRYNAHIIGFQKKGLKYEDYSLSDRDLYYKIHTLLGGYNSIIILLWIEEQVFTFFQFESQFQKTASYTKLIQGFQKISSSVLSTAISLHIKIPLIQDKQLNQINKMREIEQISQLYQVQEQSKQIQKSNLKKQKFLNYFLYSDEMSKFTQVAALGIRKKSIDLNQIKNKDIIINSAKIQKIFSKTYEKQINQKPDHIYQLTSSYHEPIISEQIFYKTCLFNIELDRICQKLKLEIISFKRIYDGNGKSHLQMIINQQVQSYLRDRIYYIENQAKNLYAIIFDPKLFPSSNQKQCKLKREAFENYSSLKRKLDISHEVLMRIYKREINNQQIGKISQAVNYWNIKTSLKNKLIRRVNLNPKMIDQVYTKIHEIVISNNNYPSLETSNKNVKHAIGNCIKSGQNFATALRNEDCLAILIEIQRPSSAIVDPGRIKIRQISPFAIRVSEFFKIYQYGINDGVLNENIGGEWFRQYGELQKENYKQMWDYWNLVQQKYTVPALVPVYLCKEHWQIAKLLMKPCLGWTATGQPLGYTFSQIQTIPFMVLSCAIRKVQELTYGIQQGQHQFENNLFKPTQYTLLQRSILDKKLMKKRFSDLCEVLEDTCKNIISDLSGTNFEEPFSEQIIKKYRNYVPSPIQRTIDIISNNSAFLAQVYCLTQMGIFQKPHEDEFNDFFKRLIEEQLRRQTDGWNEEETQNKFVNKLLNSEIEKMDIPEYVVLQSEYYDKFEQLQKGVIVEKTFIQIERDSLDMMLKKDGKFNDTQRMMLIEYKRLYQNKVLWMWYVKFRMYGETQRIKIHKWKSIDLANSYKLFTMIIQNKKQRKNYKRREAILNDEYACPFNFKEAQQYLQKQFFKIRAQKQKQNVKVLNTKKYGSAASTFVYTKSLEQAAGTLINFSLNQCQTFFNEIAKGHGIRIQQKLKLLLLGSHKNVQMFMGWKMSKKRNEQIRLAYPHIYENYKYMF